VTGVQTCALPIYLGVAGIQVPVQRSLAAYLAGNWFVFTPAGELMRAYLLGAGAKFALIAPTVVMQALVDFASLALMAILVVPAYPGLAPVVLPVTVPLLATMAMLAAPPLRRYAAGWRVLQRLGPTRSQELLEQIVRLLGPRSVAAGLLMGVPTVLAGTVALYLVGAAIDLDKVTGGTYRWDPLVANGTYAMMLLVGGISPLPQGLGVTEGTGTLMLGYMEVEPSLAVAAILLFRAAFLGFSVLLGLLALLALRLTVPELAHTPLRGVGDVAVLEPDDGLPASQPPPDA
jgi:uncharacterized membrane protein YbhN (UPF0104 family)